MTVCVFDFETRSCANLPEVGAVAYAQHPTTEIWCMCYAFDDGPVQVWTPDQPFPRDVAQHVADKGEMVAHNVKFELAIWKELRTRKGFPVLTPTQCTDTMLLAFTMGLPGKLEKAVKAARLNIEKDMAGHRLMLRMSRPRRIEPDGTIVWWNDADRIARLIDYCKADVEAERALLRYCQPLSKREQQVAAVDHRINSRGVYLDRPLAEAALRLTEIAKKRLDDEMFRLTAGTVEAAGNAPQLTTWLRSVGVETDSVAKPAVIELLRRDLPYNARRALELRSVAAKSSNAKIGKMLARVNAEGRITDTMQQNAAGTGRWGGRLIQPQNLPRPEILHSDEDIDEAVLYVRTGDIAAIERVFGPPLVVVSDLLRSMICAPPGKELIVGDWSAIEGRGLPWLAGETWKVEAYRDHDRGIGDEVYRITAGRILGKAPKEVTKAERHALGKTPELACIVEGELVLTDEGLIPIESVPVTAKVWDGVEWVSHDGPIARGYRGVVTHDGLTATRDHIVWASDGQPTGFGEAASSGQRLLQSGAGGQALRVGSHHKPRTPVHERVERRACANAMHRLRQNPLDKFSELVSWAQQRLSEMLPAEACARLAEQTTNGGQESLHQPERPRMEKLRRARNRVSIQKRRRSGFVGDREPWAAKTESRTRNRPDGQQRALRARQPEMGDGPTESLQQTEHTARQQVPLHPATLPRNSICRQYAETADGKANSATDSKAVAQAKLQTKRRVWDLLNCGPRNRFTVSGRLVHNCGYQGGVGAFVTMADTLGVDMDAHYETVVSSAPPGNVELAEDAYETRGVNSEISREAWIASETIKIGWRRDHPAIVTYWGALERAAVQAVQNPDKIFGAGPQDHRRIRFRMVGGHLYCRLPSGRKICYPWPELKKTRTSWGKEKLTLTYETVNMQGQWVRVSTYGGKLSENVTQAVCADILREALLLLEDTEYETVMHVHDEIVSEVEAGKGCLNEFSEKLCARISWAFDLPLAASVWRGKRFKKD